MNELAIALINFVRAEIDDSNLGEMAKRVEPIESAVRKLIREELVATGLLVERDALD